MSDISHGIQYQDVQNLLGDDLSASEAHGMLIAFMCADQNSALSLWIDELSTLTNDAFSEEGILLSLYNQSKTDLNDINFSLELLLPMNEALLTRLKAFTQWCQGFLYALGASRLKLEGDALEFVNDLIEFTRLDFEADDDTEEEALALEELVEFVRMGALLVYHHSLTSTSK